MVRVKICGITNTGDALYAAERGADALGFVFAPGSPRYVDPAAAGEITRVLPPFITTVGVFVNADGGEVRAAAGLSGVDLLQFHGDEPPGFCRSFEMPYIKAFRVRDADGPEGMKGYGDASAFLLDTYSEDAYGGTGDTFDWDLAAEARRQGRVILAGGLTPENVADAVRQVRPYAVDVSSGVEAEKGVKDHEAVRRFVENAKAAGVD